MEKKRVAIYIRVSTLDQAREGYSLEAQKKILQKWCTDRKYEVYGLYADKGISGKDIDHRPSMRRLMQDAEADKFNLVIFWALSRFTRSVPDLYRTMEILQSHNIDITSYTEAFDTSTPMGRAMVGIVGVFAQLERELTGERVRAAMLVRAEQGKRTCSEILGYNLKGKDSMTINEKEAEYVRFCFDNYLKYKNLSQVAELCRNLGYHGKRGKLPTAYTIYVILTRPQYCGYNTYCNNVYKGNHEPIVSINTYNKVQHLLKMQGKIIGRKKIKQISQI